MPLDAGSVEATLVLDLDDRGFRDGDRKMEEWSRKDATAQLSFDVDDRGFASADRKLHEWGMKSSTAELKFDVDRASLSRLISDAGGAGRAIDGVATSAGNAGGGLSQFGATMQGLQWAGILAGAPAAAAALVNFGGTAVSVGSALSSLSGLLITIPQGFTAFAQGAGTITAATDGISEALKAYTTQQASADKVAQQATSHQTSDAQARAAAGRQVATAQQQVADANRQVGTAERNLTVQHQAVTQAQNALNAAIEQAKRDMQDLKRQAIESATAEKQATLNLAEAQRALDKGLRDPHTGRLQIRQLELSVVEARQAQTDAHIAATRAQQDNNQAQREGVSGQPNVVAAHQAVTQAIRAEADAHRQLEDATRGVERATQNLDYQQKQAKLHIDQANQSMQTAATTANVYQQALEQLSPAQRQFTRFLVGTREKIEGLRQVAAKNLFPGVESGIESALKNFPRIRAVVGETARTLGHLAEMVGKFLGSKQFGRDLTLFAHTNLKLFDDLARSGLHFAHGLELIMRDAQPFIRWLGRLTEKLGEAFNSWARTGHQTGKFTAFFRETQRTLPEVLHLIGNLFHLLTGIGEAAAPVGNKILQFFNRSLKAWSEWSHSIVGQVELRAFFERLRVPFEDLLKLLAGLGKAMLDLFGSERGQEMLDKLTQALIRMIPAVESIGETIVEIVATLGPSLLDLLNSFLIVIADGAPELEVFAKAIAFMADELVKLLDAVPGLSQLTGTIAAWGLAMAGVKWVVINSGIRDLGKGLYNVFRRGGIIEQAPTRVSAFMDSLVSFPSRLRTQAGRVVAAVRETFLRIGSRLGLVTGTAMAEETVGTESAAAGSGGLIGRMKGFAGRILRSLGSMFVKLGALIGGEMGSAAAVGETGSQGLIGGLVSGTGRAITYLRTKLGGMFRALGAFLGAQMGGSAVAAEEESLAAGQIATGATAGAGAEAGALAGATRGTTAAAAADAGTLGIVEGGAGAGAAVGAGEAAAAGTGIIASGVATAGVGAVIGIGILALTDPGGLKSMASKAWDGIKSAFGGGSSIGQQIGEDVSAAMQAQMKRDSHSFSISTLIGDRRSLKNDAQAIGIAAATGLDNGTVEALTRTKDRLQATIRDRLRGLRLGQTLADQLVQAKHPVGAATKGLMDQFDRMNDDEKKTFLQSVKAFVNAGEQAGVISRKQGRRIEDFWHGVRTREAKAWDRFIGGITSGLQHFTGQLFVFEHSSERVQRQMLGNAAKAAGGFLGNVPSILGQLSAGLAAGGTAKPGVQVGPGIHMSAQQFRRWQRSLSGGQQGGLVTAAGIVGFAGGGVVGGTMRPPGPTDTVLAGLTPGEIVLPRKASQAIQNAVGPITAGTEKATKAILKMIRRDVSDSYSGLLSDVSDAEDKLMKGNRDTWQKVHKDTNDEIGERQGQNGTFWGDVYDAISGVGNSWDQITSKMVDQTQGRFGTIAQTAQRQGQNFAGYVKGAMREASDATYQGTSYIAEAVTKALKAFDSKSKFHLTVDKPNVAQHAQGGMIAGQGRQDTVPLLLGMAAPGEAILTRYQQGWVETALRNTFGMGLGDLFSRETRPHGFAKGGTVGDYVYPFPKGTALGRTDMGVDLGGVGTPIGAVGDAVVTSTYDYFAPSGYPPAGGMLYRLLGGAPKGYSPSSNYIYTYEGVKRRPHTGVGTKLHAGQVFGSIGLGSDTSIEMGWADASGAPIAAGGYHEGDVTAAGSSFRQFLEDLSHGRAISASGAGSMMAQIGKIAAKGTAGPVMDLVNAALGMERGGANDFLSQHARVSGQPGFSVPTAKGSLARRAGQIARKLKAPHRAALSLFEALWAESTMGQASSNVLQLIPQTAASAGIGLSDADAQIASFLQNAYGFGPGAIQLAKTTSEPAYAIAQDIQGSGAGQSTGGRSNYGAQAARASATLHSLGYPTFREGGYIGRLESRLKHLTRIPALRHAQDRIRKIQDEIRQQSHRLQHLPRHALRGKAGELLRKAIHGEEHVARQIQSHIKSLHHQAHRAAPQIRRLDTRLAARLLPLFGRAEHVAEMGGDPSNLLRNLHVGRAVGSPALRSFAHARTSSIRNALAISRAQAPSLGGGSIFAQGGWLGSGLGLTNVSGGSQQAPIYLMLDADVAGFVGRVRAVQNGREVELARKAGLGRLTPGSIGRKAVYAVPRR